MRNFSRPTGSLRPQKRKQQRNHYCQATKTIYTEDVTAPTTHDHARSQMMTLFVALVYNWWSLFTRLSNPNKRAEAITSRPLLLHAIGRKTSHSNQSTLTLTSLHAEANKIQLAVAAVAGFLSHIRSMAEQLKPIERWRLILLAVTRAFPLTPSVGPAPVGFKMA